MGPGYYKPNHIDKIYNNIDSTAMRRACRNAYSGFRTKTPQTGSGFGFPSVHRPFKKRSKATVDGHRMTQGPASEYKEPKSRVSSTLTSFYKMGESRHLLLEYLNNLDKSTEKSLSRNDSCESTLRRSMPGSKVNPWVDQR